MTFPFLPLRFVFTALEPVAFPRARAANTLRGALGLALRPGSQAYTRIFEPGQAARPFVLRVRHLDGLAFSPGQSFEVGLNLFLCDDAARAQLTAAFHTLGQTGLGPGRGRAQLTNASGSPVELDLAPLAQAPRRIRVDFLTPTELKYANELAERPEFPILFSRVRDRLSTLRRLYGEGPVSALEMPPVQMTRCDLQHLEAERRSGKTGQTHGLGGFIGTAEYEGDLRGFLPLLRAAQVTGIGRQCVWGKGEIQMGQAG